MGMIISIIVHPRQGWISYHISALRQGLMACVSCLPGVCDKPICSISQAMHLHHHAQALLLLIHELLQTVHTGERCSEYIINDELKTIYIGGDLWKVSKCGSTIVQGSGLQGWEQKLDNPAIEKWP